MFFELFFEGGLKIRHAKVCAGGWTLREGIRWEGGEDDMRCGSRAGLLSGRFGSGSRQGKSRGGSGKFLRGCWWSVGAVEGRYCE